MKKYEVKNNKVIRSNPFCPRCGKGVMMADRGEWWACGKCGDRYKKTSLNPEMEKACPRLENG